MAHKYLSGVLTPGRTPQTEPMRDDQVANDAGGFSWKVSDWERLDQFLINGTEGGTYYVSEQKLTRDNAKVTVRLLKSDGPRVVARVAEISDQGLAPKNDPALFVLATAFAVGDDATKRAATVVLPRVVRNGTHLLHFIAFVDASGRGWGRSVRRAVQSWFLAKDARSLAYQAMKYKERDGWSLRDALRMSHPIFADPDANVVANWIVKGGWESVGDAPHDRQALRQLWAAERAKALFKADPKRNRTDIVGLIREYRLPREVLPTELLTDTDVWLALLDDMPMTALIRNLGTMTKNGTLTVLSEAERLVVAQLGDPERIKRARVHPIALLSALRVYAAGHGERSDATWTPLPRVIDALDAAFYAAFQTVEPTGKRTMLALDVSGSMVRQAVNGLPGMTCPEAGAALALVTANVEPHWAFTTFDERIRDVAISPRQRLDDVMTTIGRIGGYGTDCGLPMRTAAHNKVPVDAFVLFTDSETWAGEGHPAEELVRYRTALNLPRAKLVVVSMAATGLTVGDPTDGGVLNTVGLDASAPAVIANFIRAE